MRVEAAFAAYPVLATSPVERGEVGGQRRARSWCMVQVTGNAAKQKRLAPDTGILESRAEFLVFGAPALKSLRRSR